ncbi:MAG: DNA polymerase III subunit alpha [candidate division WOR-3 bacterium]|nr:DNA polymerase III subunit alpha [candidate division WOR-3 bacterium]
MKTFIHLHNHTEYSLLDGAMNIRGLVELAHEYNMEALAITDHGNLFGAIEFYKEAKEKGIKPIIGMETYVATGSRKNQTKDSKVPESSYHLTLLCENEIGYKNLIKLTSFAYLEGFYYKPRVDKELLGMYHDGIIALSGCFKGEIPYKLNAGDERGAEYALQEYQEIFGKDNFYIELIRLGLKGEEEMIKKLVKLSQKYDAPIVATNDCHYFTADDYKAHDVLLCIGTKKTLKDKERLKFETRQAYFRSPGEMAELFNDLPEAISNSWLIGERCNLLIDTSGKDVKLPSFPRPEGYESDFDYLKELTYKNIEKKFPHMGPEIKERLDYELKVIKKMGLVGYFLIVHDIIQFAKRNKIPVGPGRGSAVGSLVLYALDITEVNPLEFNLLFERFLNPERVSLPDIDIDFSDTRREEVLDYIKKRYGVNNVSQIITFGTMQARAVVRDVARVLDIPYEEVDRIAKLIPPHKKISQVLEEDKEFKSLINSKKEYVELIEIAKKLEGLARHPSIHAAGVVITPRELIEYVPLYRNPEKGDISTQYDKNALESIGLLKMDILGLKTLTIIDECLKMVNLKKEDIPFNDKMTYNLLKEGRTTGVFQLESQGMQDLLRSMQPERFEDIIAIIALYRPGPMGNVNIQKLIENKQNPGKISYLHPRLEPILKETYGIILYQEQVMQIASSIAGFTLAEADNLRRAMAKKIPELMYDIRERFITGAAKNGIHVETAEKIFNLIAPFAGYGFNKSHATAYAVIAYQTAYLKAHFPLEFMLCSLNSEMDDTDRINVLIKDARGLGIEILPPDINKSFNEFKKEENCIRYGLGAIKNLGKPAADTIVKERSRGIFRSFLDFQVRCKGLNKKAIESLIKAGAFASLEPDIEKLLKRVVDKKIENAQETLFGDAQSNKSIESKNVFIKKSCLDYFAFEKEAFGFYFREHPLEKYREEFKYMGLIPASRINDLENGKVISIGGILHTKRIRKDKKGREYAILTIEDLEGNIDVFVFADHFEKYRGLLKEDNLLVVKGAVFGEEEKKKLKAEFICSLQEVYNYYQKIVIECRDLEIQPEKLKSLYDLMDKYRGECEVWFQILDSDGFKSIRSRSIKINPRPEVLSKIREIFGESALKIIRRF